MKTKQITFKESSEDLEEAGDCCITKSLSNAKDDKVIEAIVMLCPFCGMAMATTSIHRIKRPWSKRLSKFLSIFGLPYGVSVTPMIQCPYDRSHSFEIKRGKFYQIKNGI